MEYPSNRGKWGGGSWGRSFKRLAPTESPSVKDIAWAAGVFEGEGTCRDQMGNGSPQLSVAQKDAWLTARLRALFGGSNKQYVGSNGYVYWKWWLTGPRARGFLMTIYVMCSPRRQLQIRQALGCE